MEIRYSRAGIRISLMEGMEQLHRSTIEVAFVVY
jgi:hypothetical protein